MPREITQFTMNEASICAKGANDSANHFLLKSEDAPQTITIGMSETISKADRVDLQSTEADGHVHGIALTITNCTLDFVVYYSLTPNAMYSHDHQVVKDEANRRFVLIMEEGHEHYVSFEDVDKVLREVRLNKSSGLTNETLDDLLKTATHRGLLIKNKENDTMSDTNANANATVAKTEDSTNANDVEVMKAQIETLTKVNALTSDERTHYNSLEKSEDKDAFLNKSADERTADLEAIAKADNADTVTIDGRTFQKSDTNGIEMAKELSDLKKANFDNKVNDFIAKELNGVPGDPAILKSTVSLIMKSMTGDEQTNALNLLKAKNDTLAKSTESISEASDSSDETVAKSATDTQSIINKKADELMESNPGLSKSDAIREVMHSNPDLN